MYKFQIGNAGYAVECELERHCPYCATGIVPNVVKQHLEIYNGKVGTVVFLLQCPSCRGFYVATYEIQEGAPSIGLLKHQHRQKPAGKIELPEELKAISPDFFEIYSQTVLAEAAGLDQLVGMGYRKALEFLIKDYLIGEFPTRKSDIEEEDLGKSINRIKDEDFRHLARASSWLGNDETHYQKRQNIGYDIADMKRLIEAAAYFISYRASVRKARQITQSHLAKKSPLVSKPTSDTLIKDKPHPTVLPQLASSETKVLIPVTPQRVGQTKKPQTKCQSSKQKQQSSMTRSPNQVPSASSTNRSKQQPQASKQKSSTSSTNRPKQKQPSATPQSSKQTSSASSTNRPKQKQPSATPQASKQTSSASSTNRPKQKQPSATPQASKQTSSPSSTNRPKQKQPSATPQASKQTSSPSSTNRPKQKQSSATPQAPNQKSSTSSTKPSKQKKSDNASKPISKAKQNLESQQKTLTKHPADTRKNRSLNQPHQRPAPRSKNKYHFKGVPRVVPNHS